MAPPELVEKGLIIMGDCLQHNSQTPDCLDPWIFNFNGACITINPGVRVAILVPLLLATNEKLHKPTLPRSEETADSRRQALGGGFRIGKLQTRSTLYISKI